VTESASMTRTEALLATIILQNMTAESQAEKCVVLSRAGLSNGEIADLVGTSSAVVKQSLYAARKSSGKSGAKKAAVKKTAVKKAQAKKPTAGRRSSKASVATTSVLRGGIRE